MPDPDLFPGVQIHHKGGTYAVLDAGAHVLNWTPPGQQPVLWESPLARFEPGVAVRGGVPVIFPWFSAGLTGDRTPAHGFARTANWVRESVTDDVATTGRLQVVHSLTADGFDSAPFVARLIAELRLVTDLLAAVERGAAPAWVEVHPQNYFGAGGPPHRWRLPPWQLRSPPPPLRRLLQHRSPA